MCWFKDNYSQDKIVLTDTEVFGVKSEPRVELRAFDLIQSIEILIPKNLVDDEKRNHLYLCCYI